MGDAGSVPFWAPVVTWTSFWLASVAIEANHIVFHGFLCFSPAESWVCTGHAARAIRVCLMRFPALPGHPKEKAEQRSDWTAGLDWQPLWSQEKGRGRAGCPQGEDCESFCSFPVPDWETLCRCEAESISPLPNFGRKLNCHVQKWLPESPLNGFSPHPSPLSASHFMLGNYMRAFCCFWQGSRWLALYKPKLLVVVGRNTGGG